MEILLSHKQNRFFKDPALPHVECRHTYDSDAHYTPHRHATLSIGAITEGVASFTSGDQTRILPPDSLIVLNPETVHACNPIEGEARSYKMLYLDTDWCAQLQAGLFGEVESFVPLSRILIDDEDLLRGYHSLVDLLLDPQALYLEKEEALESFAVSLFGRYCDRRSRPESIPPLQRQRVECIREYLREHLRDNPTTADLAQAAGVSSSHLIRLFGEATGLSPRRYLFELRIEKARELLSTTEMPIAEIALEVGFFDQSHLNRVFKQIVACTPHEYRKGVLGSRVS